MFSAVLILGHIYESHLSLVNVNIKPDNVVMNDNVYYRRKFEVIEH